MKTKLIALALVLAMAIPMFVSCDDKKKKPVDTEVETQAKDEDVDEETAMVDAYIDDLAGKYNFDGQTFVWVGGGQQAPKEESETGDVASDALYYRQRDIEEKFKIKWSNYSPEQVEGSSNHPVVDALMQEVLAGGDSYDAGYGTMVAVCQPLFIQDTLTNVENYTVIDLDQPWWTPSLRDTFAINGAIYFLNGAISTSNYQDTYCVLFNKEVAKDYGIDEDELYKLASDGKWTFDKMVEIAEAAIPTNENGSGVYRYAEPIGYGIMLGLGIQMTKFDKDGIPYVDAQISAEVSNLADKVSAIMGDDTQTANRKYHSVGGYMNMEEVDKKYGYESFSDLFADGKSLFIFSSTIDAAALREKDVQFGVLPMPKGSEKQESYVCQASPWGSFQVFVPKCTKDADTTDVILEAMAALGYKYIKPAYYDKILKSRSTHDRASKEMIDIVFESKVYDLIDIIALDGSPNQSSAFVNVVEGAFAESSASFASKYFIQALKINGYMDTTISKINKDR